MPSAILTTTQTLPSYRLQKISKAKSNDMRKVHFSAIDVDCGELIQAGFSVGAKREVC